MTGADQLRSVAGGWHADERIFVDFGRERNGPVAREIRYRGRDCTSDIFT